MDDGGQKKAELKQCQKKIISSLLNQINSQCTPATRQQLAKCLASLYHAGDTFGLFETVNKFTEIIKSRDDSPQQLLVKLAAIACLGAIYQKIGRMVATLFHDTQQTLIKFIKLAESEAKCEVLFCLERMLTGLGNAASSGFRDIYKACRNCLADKAMPVRCAAAKCSLELSKHANSLYTSELDTMAQACFKALEGSNYDVRICVAELLGTLMASSQKQTSDGGKVRKVSMEEMFSMMNSGFLRGSVGFLKGGGGELLKSGVSREVRVGVTQAYVVLFRELGTAWIEKYIAGVIVHVLELVANSKATTTHVDAVYSRKCVTFILHSIFFNMLPEAAQIQAVKELCKIVTRQMNAVHKVVTGEIGLDSSMDADVINTQHVLVCALEEMASLILELSSSLENILSNRVVDAIFSALIHPAPATWLSAAWCIRCCAVGLPLLLTRLIDKCTDKMNSLRSSPEAVTGYGYTLAAMIGGLYQCPLGIPIKKAKTVFNLADEMLQSSGQGGRLAHCKIQTGWVLMGALMTLAIQMILDNTKDGDMCLSIFAVRYAIESLCKHIIHAVSLSVQHGSKGPSFSKGCLLRMFQLWTGAFPSSPKEIDAEKNKGNTETWQLTLENRSGALCSIASFIQHCSQIVTHEVSKKLMISLETALATVPSLHGVCKTHGSQLKPFVAMLKLRLYQALILLPPKSFEGSFSPLLRELVSEFTLADHRGATTTSLLQGLCHKDDSILLGSWLQETDHKKVEEQLQSTSASGSGALEHDPACVYARCQTGDLPGPLPLGVAVIDAAIKLFGQVFPFVANKHRSQLMEHFNECIMKNKGPRQQAIQMNIFTAFLAALKSLADAKTSLGEDSVRNSANNLVQDALMNLEPVLRCAAGEALGRMAQVVNDSNFVAQMALLSFEKAKAARDAVSRTGHSLALGCLHRYVGGMGSGQHLNNTVAILLALAKDESSALVQVWALHALTSTADTGGPMFRSFVEPFLSLVVDLALQTPPSMTEVHQCLGKCLSALITSLGPELQDSSKTIQRLRMFCMTICSVMQNHPDSLVQSEATACMQQLHLFAPNFLNLSTFVPQLCTTLLSGHLLLRRASVACLRQLAQREAKDVCEHGLEAIKSLKDVKQKMFVGEQTLEGLLFTLFDAEVDLRLRADIRETLVSLLQALASENLSHWLSMCYQVLLASKAEEKSEASKKGKGNKSKEKQQQDDQDDEDEAGGLTLAKKPAEKQTVTPNWTTRVFAMECIRMIIETCKQNKAHLDLAYAREIQEKTQKKDYLVMQLAELVRMVFIAGTSNNDRLRLEGMKALQDVVELFAKAPDPDIPGNLILEQFQAQVGTALRPAFTPSTPPNITAMACEVCSAWIGSEISSDISDVRRIQQLLTTSLDKLSKEEDQSKRIYSESAYTLETLAVLKAWAQIYIMAMKHEHDTSKPKQSEDEDSASSSSGGSLLDLVAKDLRLLAKHWMSLLRDYAFLSLPPQYSSQLPSTGGTFYSPETIDAVRPHYRNAWAPIAYAFSLWLNTHGFRNPQETVLGAADETPAGSNVDADSMLGSTTSPDDINKDRYHMLSGLCSEVMCAPLASYPSETVDCCLHATDILLDSEFGRGRLSQDKTLSIELLIILYRLLLTREGIPVQHTILSVVQKVSKASLERIERQKLENDDNKEDGLEDDISQGKSVVFSLLEICMFVVSRYAPEMVPAANAKPAMTARKSNFEALSGGAAKLLCQVAVILSELPCHCTPTASVSTLPSILYLHTGILKYLCKLEDQDGISKKQSIQDDSSKQAFQTVLQSLKTLVSSDHAKNQQIKDEWIKLLQSALISVLGFANNKSLATSTGAAQPVSVNTERILLVISIYILSAPSEVVLPDDLLHDCIKVFTDSLQSTSPQVELRSVKLISTIIQSTDQEISYQFIHGCVPVIVSYLEKAQGQRPGSELELILCKDGLQLLETLVEMAEQSLRFHMMAILIPCLVQLLLDGSQRTNPSKFASQLHDHCLQRLTKIGPLYPEPFKIVMGQSPELKQKLEAAVRNNQGTARRAAGQQEPKAAAKPKIQLKMDFSNFK